MKRKLDLEHRTILQPRIQPQPAQQIIYTTFKAPAKITAVKQTVRTNCPAGRKQRVRSGPLPIAPATSCPNHLPPVPIPKNPHTKFRFCKLNEPMHTQIFMKSCLKNIGFCLFNPLSAKPTNWSNTLKQFFDYCRQIV